MNTTKTATCKRCGSIHVAWVKSKRTGRYYLAFATLTSSREQGTVFPQTPHDCTNTNRGGFNTCPFCGKHHRLTGVGGQDANPKDCTEWPDAK